MSPPATSAPSPSTLYRRVWRWHFYAGLICLPFLALLAITGAMYLYKDSIESLVYRSLLFAPTTIASQRPAINPESLVTHARAAIPGEPIRFVAPAHAGRSAEVGVRTDSGVISVFLDPADGRVLGYLRDDRRLMEVVKRVHSLAIGGPVANHWIEIVAGWAIVLVISGVFLWWPRGRRGGVASVRGRPSQRLWWRDLHAVVGVFAGAAIVFLAVTGMPWSAFWGQQFGRLANEWGVGLPAYVWGKPQSSLPLANIGDVPWALAQAPLPLSAHHADSGSSGHATSAQANDLPSVGLNQALSIFSRMGLPDGTPVGLPIGPRGVYTAMFMPDDTTTKRVVHLDRYSGAVLADVGYANFGIVGQATEWGISIHTGRQFGWINQLVMLAGCLAIISLAISATVMWWKRRPVGRLGAPPRHSSDSAAKGAIMVAIVLGLFYPLLGASMLVALLIDAAVPRLWHERFGL